MREDCWYKNVCTQNSCDSCIRYTEMSYLMENSGIPKKKRIPTRLTAGVDREAFERLADIKDDIKDFVDAGNNIYICSDETGNGKTSWAIKLLLKYFDCIWAGNGLRVRGYFIHVPTFLSTMKDFSDSHSQLKYILMNADLVIWDDIASTKMSDYDIAQLLIYIDQRTLQEYSNIYTGNIIDKEQLEKCVGSKLASRIYQSEIIQFKGKDRR